jgi:hypothetical protein
MAVRKLAAIASVVLASLVLVGCEPVDTSSSQSRTGSKSGSTQSKQTTTKTRVTQTKRGTNKTTVTQTNRTTTTTSGSKSKSGSTTSSTSYATVKIAAPNDVCWAGQINRASKFGCGSSTVQLMDPNGSYTVSLHKTRGSGPLTAVVLVNGNRVDSGSVSSSSSVISISYAESH